jgi:hypothetical protein
MLTSSVLVAVLTSTLTVRGMGHSGAPIVAPTVAAHADSIVTVAAAPLVTPRDSTPAVRAPRAADTVLSTVASRADSAPQHEDGGTVAPPPATSPRL